MSSRTHSLSVTAESVGHIVVCRSPLSPSVCPSRSFAIAHMQHPPDVHRDGYKGDDNAETDAQIYPAQVILVDLHIVVTHMTVEPVPASLSVFVYYLRRWGRGVTLG